MIDRLYHIPLCAVVLGLYSCVTPQKVCPAFQSAFIHDKETLDKKFSYFEQDSTPKILEANKNRYLLIEPTSYKKKLEKFRSIPAIDIYPQKIDSLQFDDDLLDDQVLAEEGDDFSVSKANSEDSTYVISLKKEKFNIDQELYLWYLRENLVYPDEKLKKNLESKEKVKGFKRLFGFGKRKKNNQESKFDIETSATELDKKSKKRQKKELKRELKRQNTIEKNEEKINDSKSKEEVSKDTNDDTNEEGNDF